MRKHWKATVHTPHVAIYVTTRSESAERISDGDQNVRGGTELNAAHRRVALEAIDNYARPRGLRLIGPPEEIDSTPPDLHEIAWLSEFASKHTPFSPTATVYEDFED